MTDFLTYATWGDLVKADNSSPILRSAIESMSAEDRRELLQERFSYQVLQIGIERRRRYPGEGTQTSFKDWSKRTHQGTP